MNNTLLLHAIARILSEAAKVGKGDFVNLSYSCTASKTHYDHGMYLFAMNLQMARVLRDSMNEVEASMCRLMQPERPSPSLIGWLQLFVTNHEGVESGEIKCCRVYPSIGHIMNYVDPTAESQLSMETYP